MATLREIKRSARRELKPLIIFAIIVVSYAVGRLEGGCWQVVVDVFGGHK